VGISLLFNKTMGCIQTKHIITAPSLVDDPLKLRIRIPKDDLDNNFRPLRQRLLKKTVVPSIKRSHE